MKKVLGQNNTSCFMMLLLIFSFVFISNITFALQFSEVDLPDEEQANLRVKFKDNYVGFLERCAQEKNYCMLDCKELLENIGEDIEDKDWLVVDEIAADKIETHKVYAIGAGYNEVGFDYVIAENRQTGEHLELHTCHNTLMRGLTSRALRGNDYSANKNFNKMISSEDIPLETDEDIADFIEYYLFITFYANKYVLVQNFEKIMSLGVSRYNEGELRKDMLEKYGKSFQRIHPLRIERKDDTARATFFSWSIDYGFLSEWDVSITKTKPIKLIINKQLYLNDMSPVGVPYLYSHSYRD